MCYMNSMTDLILLPDQGLVPSDGSDINLPAIVTNTTGDAKTRFLEFFAVTIRNRNTRTAYMRAIGAFLGFCERGGLTALPEITPLHVAAYIEILRTEERRSISTTKQHLAAIRMLFDYLVRHQILRENPATSVKTEKLKRMRGATPYRQANEVRVLFDAMEMDKITDYRDRALIALMAYTFARIGAAVAMDVKDIYTQGRVVWVRLHEKNGIEHAMPCHHQLADYLEEYVERAGIRDQPDTPLFRSATRQRIPQLTENRLNRHNAWSMVKRRAGQAGLPLDTTNHTFRATGLTTFLENGGSIEDAQRMAAHSALATTQIYDRREDAVTIENVERIRY
jgi:site-specific recombinase XerD